VSDTSKGISVGCTNAEVYVRVEGRGTFQNSQPLRRFALDMVERGYKVFIVDLGHCLGMDSTFLGVLAGVGLRLRQVNGGGCVHITNVSPRNMELLQTLGLDRLFDLEGKPAGETMVPPAEKDFRQLPDSDASDLKTPLNKNETTDLMLEAHTNLTEADERNIPKFKDLTKYLRENIARRRGETPPEDSKP
jgi:anti-anti-sigma regulatory factor